MSEERKKQLDKMVQCLNGLTPEQANRAMERATDFLAGAAFAERKKEAEHEAR